MSDLKAKKLSDEVIQSLDDLTKGNDESELLDKARFNINDNSIGRTGVR